MFSPVTTSARTADVFTAEAAGGSAEQQFHDNQRFISYLSERLLVAFYEKLKIIVQVPNQLHLLADCRKLKSKRMSDGSRRSSSLSYF